MSEQIRPKVSFWEKAFIVWTVIYPITVIYKIPGFSALTVGDIGYVVILLMLLMKREMKPVAFIPGIVTLAFMLPWLLVSAFSGANIFMRTLRFMFSTVILTVFVPNFFYPSIALPLFKKVAVVSASYVILQFLLATFFRYELPGSLPFLDVSQSIQVLYDNAGNPTVFRRFQGFFSEPSAAATFLATALVCSLAEEKRKLKQYLPELLMVLAILLAQATTGLGLLMIIGAYWLVKSKQKKWMLVLLAIPLVVFVELQFGLISKMFTRGLNLTSGGLQIGVATVGRVSKFTSAFDTTGLTLTQVLFGQGMVPLTEFIPGWGRCFIYFGIAGVLFFVLLYLYLFLKTKGYARLLTVCIVAINFFADLFFGVTPLFILPYIILLSRHILDPMPLARGVSASKD